MEVYLIQKAKNYASKSKFNDKIKRFKIDNSLNKNWEQCNIIYKEYKNFCNFDGILEFGYLFEKNSDLYNDIKYKIRYTNSEDDFRNIYRDQLGEIYKKVFGKLPLKANLLEKVEDANEKVLKLFKCVENRIKYHFWCKNNQTKYNVASHEYEILISIYMYNRIIDIKDILNEYRERYLEFKEKLKQEKLILDERIERLDDLSSLSSNPLTEPFITNKKDEKRRKPKK